jgi:hypothetical protein
MKSSRKLHTIEVVKFFMQYLQYFALYIGLTETSYLKDLHRMDKKLHLLQHYNRSLVLNLLHYY